jgi:membrane-bound lytic murein transglycosylase B
MRIFLKGCLTLVLAASSTIWADSTMLEKPEVHAFIQKMVNEQHFNKKYLQNVFSNAQFKPDIIEKITKPYESKPWDSYRDIFIKPERIQQGVQFSKAHAKTLKDAERVYGVPPEIIVAILGVETIYGKQQGHYRVIDALSTLSFYYPKRAAYFEYELEEYLKMCRQYHLNPLTQLGSYAGAMGQGQFMPGSYRRWAVKYKGIGAPDIIHNTDDAIFSIANYLHKHHWQSHEQVTQMAQLVSHKCHHIDVNARKAKYTYEQLLHCGIRAVERSGNHPNQAGLLALDTSKGPEYWVAFPNFYVILSYNSSPLYGLAVYLLGQSIAKSA